MRNPLLSNTLKQTPIRLLVIDDNQISFNHIVDLLHSHGHQVQGLLLDDATGFQKQLQQTWDVVIFGRAYDLKLEHALNLIEYTQQSYLPVLSLSHEDEPSTQSTQVMALGVYDVVSLAEPQAFYLNFMRALNFSQLQQHQVQLLDQLATAQHQAHTLVEDSHRPVAIIEEGIHLHANAEYLNLFGLHTQEDIIGLPLLDVLQPNDVSEFKSRFKKISQGQFELGRFCIQSGNLAIGDGMPLTLEFSSAPDHEDALQLSIDQGDVTLSVTPVATPIAVEAIETHIEPQSEAAYQHINHYLQQQPSALNAVVVFSLADFPAEILEHAWHTPQDYLLSMQDFLSEQIAAKLFSIDPFVHAVILQAQNKTALEAELIALTSLLKPQLLAVGQQSYPLRLKIGYRILDSAFADQNHFKQLLTDAFSQPLPSHAREESPSFNLEPEAPHEQLSVLDALQQRLNSGQIQLKYQQMYDKQDTDLHIYEVTSGFTYQNRWISLNNLHDLDEQPELSIQVDRWILVEACKQLHNFIKQYPKAKLIVNLNKHVLLEDPNLPDLVTKLLSIVGSQEQRPVWLQFSEQDLSTHFAEAQRQITILHEHGANISARDFGYSMYSESILKQIELSIVSLHDDLVLALHNDNQTLELQQRLNEFYEIKHVDILLHGLDDMTLFANSWNLDARFIQGDYFQKKLDHLVAVDD